MGLGAGGDGDRGNWKGETVTGQRGGRDRDGEMARAGSGEGEMGRGNLEGKGGNGKGELGRGQQEGGDSKGANGRRRRRGKRRGDFTDVWVGAPGRERQ